MGPNRKRVTHFSELEPVQIRMDEQLEAEKMEPEVATTVKVGPRRGRVRLAGQEKLPFPSVTTINLGLVTVIYKQSIDLYQ